MEAFHRMLNIMSFDIHMFSVKKRNIRTSVNQDLCDHHQPCYVKAKQRETPTTHKKACDRAKEQQQADNVKDELVILFHLSHCEFRSVITHILPEPKRTTCKLSFAELEICAQEIYA